MAETIPRLRASDPPEAIEAALRESGVVVVDEMLDATALARFNAEVDPHLEAAARRKHGLVNPAVEWFFGPHTLHFTGVAGKCRTFVDELLCHPVLMAACDAFLLPSCARYQLNIAHVLDRGPGADPQLLHRDELVWCYVPRPHPELQLASILALSEFRADNGATRIVPGSHRWPLEREPEPDEVVAAEMPQGAAVLYLGTTIHGGGPNTTADQRRRGMHLSYTLGWLRTEENHYLATPPDVARTLPPQAQEILGYAAHDALASGGGYLGTVDTADPLALLRAGDL